jgi:hypothetical protein
MQCYYMVLYCIVFFTICNFYYVIIIITYLLKWFLVAPIMYVLLLASQFDLKCLFSCMFYNIMKFIIIKCR